MLGKLKERNMAKRKLEERLNGKRDNLNSFSVVEVLIALSILLVGILGNVALMVRTLDTSILTLQKLTAAELAQEGVEIVRNIKDSKVISGSVDSWFANLSGSYYADYNDHQLNPILPGDPVPFLKKDENGFFNYDSGNPTIYKREIKIEKIDDHHLRVNSIVSWSHKGINFSVNVENHLYKY